jgi:hypothetical protein
LVLALQKKIKCVPKELQIAPAVDVTINRQRGHIADKSFLASPTVGAQFAAVGAAAGCDPVSQPSLSVWLLVKLSLLGT